MSNPFKGEFPLKIGDQEFTLRGDFDALVTIEDKTGKRWHQVLADVASGDFAIKDLRTVFFALLQANHPEVTERMAGELVMQAGLDEVRRAFAGAGRAAIPETSPGDANGADTADPQKAAAGISDGSPRAH